MIIPIKIVIYGSILTEKWIIRRKSGSPTSHTFHDSIITDPTVFKRLFDSSKAEKMAKLVISVNPKSEP